MVVDGAETVSTHLIFGRNLRILCRRQGTIAQVAEKLDINRVQMNRILNGESFPKPGLMKRICDLFDVDARVLLQPLSELEETKPNPADPVAQLTEAMNYAFFGRDSLVHEGQDCDVVQDGLHLILRPSFLYADRIWVSMVRFHTKNGIRMVRGVDPVARGMKRSNVTPIRQREFRGALLRVSDGVGFLYSTNSPHSPAGLDYFSTRSWLTYGFLAGTCVFMSASNPIGRSVVPCILQPLEQNARDILRGARMTGFRNIGDLSPHYRETLLGHL